VPRELGVFSLADGVCSTPWYNGKCSESLIHAIYFYLEWIEGRRGSIRGQSRDIPAVIPLIPSPYYID